MADTRTLTDRARSALIREWAAEQGFEISATGRIPKGVVAAYETATSQAVDDGLDWNDALSSSSNDAADPLAALEDQLGEAAAGDTLREAGPPPPADLDEARARFHGKPKPSPWAKDTGKPGRGQQPPIKVNRQVISDIEGKLTLLLTGPALMWQTVDPLCGGAFADNLDNIVKKAVPLICQSPDAVRWFTKGTTFLLWLDLVWALQPVAQAVYAHHVAASVMILPDGRVVAAKRLEDGRIVPADQVPRQARPDVSQYTTQVAGHVPPVPA